MSSDIPEPPSESDDRGSGIKSKFGTSDDLLPGVLPVDLLFPLPNWKLCLRLCPGSGLAFLLDELCNVTTVVRLCISLIDACEFLYT